jgi:NAD(P)-dependent dehydrogenase (short-subunit alcohol dehydrogenase family)
MLKCAPHLMESIMDYQPPHRHLQDRVILVTGAGQGIGRTAALAFAAQGAIVILLGRKVKKLEAVYDEIESAGGPQPVIFPMNLEKAGESDYQGLAEGIYQQLGRLDGILHNASRFDNLSPLEIQTEEQLTGMLKVNLIAPFALTKACLPLLKRAPDASVIVTSTTAAQKPAAFWGAHAVSKSAADTMVQIWAHELGVFPNIRINSVVPGPVQSPQRKLSHPGELHTNLPPADSLIPLYLYLMGQDSVGVTGKTFEG